ncbi:MAG: DUF1266 domain-containing protein [Roseiarcus sp.]|jgi:hypothetical protein
MDRRTQAQIDAAVAELSSFGLVGDIAGALEVVDRLIKIASGSTFVWAQLQARLLHAAMDDPRMPSELLAALIERFRWAEPISALSRFHPDLRARVAARLATAQAWYDDLKAAARRLDDAGAAARLTLRPPARMIDPKTLSPGVLQALHACVAGAQRFGPLLGGSIDPEAIERVAEAVRVEATPINPLAYVGVAGSRLPDGARWAIALSAMYTIAQRGTDATLAPFAPARPAQSLAILRDYWGVDGETPEARRTQTIDRLEWLLNQGDRADPQCAEPGDPEAPADLLAWDLARAAMTARHACVAECLSEPEAWTYLLTIAVKAQEAFESWRDFGDRYRRGRIRWSNATHDCFDDILAFLVGDPRSPWQSLPWRLRLDASNVRDAAAENPALGGGDFVFAFWRQGRLRTQLAALFAVALVVAGWEAARLMRPQPIAVAQAPAIAVSPVADPPDDPSSARGEFDRILVVFVANGEGARAQFRNAPAAHPLADFRYGVDHAAPDRALTPKLLEKANRGLPQALDLPPGAHFLTIQAQLDSGAISPVRRFDVPANLLAPRR